MLPLAKLGLNHIVRIAILASWILPRKHYVGLAVQKIQLLGGSGEGSGERVMFAMGCGVEGIWVKQLKCKFAVRGSVRNVTGHRDDGS